MVSLGLQKETLGVLEAPILVVSLPEHCTSHCPGSGAEAARSIPALGQGRSCLLQGSFSSFHSGLIALVSQELLMHMQMLQGAHYPEWTPQTLWVLKMLGSPAAPARGSENQSKEGNQERGLSPALKHCDISWWLCLSLQNFLIFYISSSL